jgi:hypothetical protein
VTLAALTDSQTKSVHWQSGLPRQPPAAEKSAQLLASAQMLQKSLRDGPCSVWCSSYTVAQEEKRQQPSVPGFQSSKIRGAVGLYSG